MLWNQVLSPKIAGICVVKNEQDIIEPFVRHNLKFLDSLAVLDNGSVDRTKAILKELAHEFKNLSIADDDRFGHTQSDRMTCMLREARWGLAADYVLALDGDEFIGFADRRELCRGLSQIPPGGYGLMPWRTFVLTPDTLATSATDPPRSLPWRRAQELPPHYKVVVRCDGLCEDVIIPLGSHEVISASGRQIPSVYLDNVRLLHFPLRSLDQFIAKTVVGWMAHLARDPQHRQTGYSWHRREAFDGIVNGLVIDDTKLCELSLLYAQAERSIDWQVDVIRDEPKFDYRRRYSSGKALGAVELIARSWEQSLLHKVRQESEGFQVAAAGR